MADHIQSNPFGYSMDNSRGDWPAVYIGGSALGYREPPAPSAILAMAGGQEARPYVYARVMRASNVLSCRDVRG